LFVLWSESNDHESERDWCQAFVIVKMCKKWFRSKHSKKRRTQKGFLVRLGEFG
jgi:hypothetical protein